jgi:hypothetical protein
LSRSAGGQAKDCKEHLVKRALAPAWAFKRELTEDMRSGLLTVIGELLEQWCFDHGLTGPLASSVQREVSSWVRVLVPRYLHVALFSDAIFNQAAQWFGKSRYNWIKAIAAFVRGLVSGMSDEELRNEATDFARTARGKLWYRHSAAMVRAY